MTGTENVAHFMRSLWGPKTLNFALNFYKCKIHVKLEPHTKVLYYVCKYQNREGKCRNQIVKMGEDDFMRARDFDSGTNVSHV